MHLVDLVDHQNNRHLSSLETLDDHVIALPTWLICWHHKENGIHFSKGAIGRLHHEVSKRCLWFVNPWGIDKDDLFLIRRINPHNLIARCLRLVTHDGNFLPHDVVQKR